MWTKTYGGSSAPDGISIGGFTVDPTDDGGYVIGGRFADSGSGWYWDYYLIKTDEFGDTIWTRRYGGPYHEYGSGGRQTSDGGYILIGTLSEDLINDFAIYAVKTVGTQKTLLVYLNGDNSLDTWSFADFNEMESAANNGYVKILVCWDRLGSGNSAYYLVQPDTDPNNLASYTQGVNTWSMGELNMGNPLTLTDFTSWAVSSYPSSQYSLILWNHGGGWGPQQLSPTGISWDETDGSDFFTTNELRDAVAVVKSQIGRNLDILGFDACLMGMAEVAYSLRNDCRFVIGSEELVPSTGWDYESFIQQIERTTDAETLCQDIVGSYPSQTLSAFASGASLTSIGQAVDGLAAAMIENILVDSSNIWAARHDSDLVTFDYNGDGNSNQDSYVDLAHLCQLLSLWCSSSEIVSAANAVIDALNAARVAVTYSGSYYEPAGGLSIYFPDHRPDIVGGDDFYSNYLNIGAGAANLDFTADTLWDEFLETLLNICHVLPTGIDFGVVSIGDSSNATFVIENIGYGNISGNVSEACEEFSVISGNGPYTLAPGESRVVTVQFHPTSTVGSLSCLIETGTDVCDDVLCTGISENTDPPLCLVEPDTLEFGAVALGDSLDLSFVLKNVGGGVINGNVSEMCEYFTLVSGQGVFDLGPQDSVRVGVRFKPATGGEHNCVIDTGAHICSDVYCAGVGDDLAGIETVAAHGLALYQNQPNPFSPVTTISLVLPEKTWATLTVYDATGRYVRTLMDGVLKGGAREIEWDGKDANGTPVNSGVYFYRLTAGNRTLTKKMVLLK